ncbi:MAG: 2,3-diphosphoglycerate-dependent phosphoglycerate mutase [Deltaproteobacteria bacterium]|nr:MAG: 2,3-diphosphoglycerate-dependent phosphoglycerate mutase [Deltaproteobacteria bacterium]
MASTLILLRHGQSTWNLENRFTGWHDVPLTEQGTSEAAEAGRLMAADGILPTTSHTSLLQRAILTHHLALHAMERLWIPVRRHWRLNERHYGALQGLNKKETTARHGEQQVFQWRRSYDVPPPACEPDNPFHPRQDERYRTLPDDVLPASECLRDVVVRTLPYWHDAIVPELMRGETVLVVAHGNSLRALVKHLDGISDEDIAALNIPTGVPLLYRFDDRFDVTERRYLGDADAAARKAAEVAAQAR